jgi:hypothetical protein
VDIPDTLLRLACKAAFWELPRTVLATVASSLRLAIPSGATLFELLWALVETQIGGEPDAILAICHRRLTRENRQKQTMDALMEVDEAVEVMDKYDVKRVKDSQHHAETVAASRKDFRDGFFAKANSLRSSAKKKARVAKRVVLPHHIAQGDAKRFTAPATFVWRDITRGGWCGHCPPNSRVSESFDKHGGSSDLALKALLRTLWTQHAEKSGQKPEEVCNIDGIF